MEQERTVIAGIAKGIVPAVGVRENVSDTRNSSPQKLARLLKHLSLVVFILLAPVGESTLSALGEENMRWSFNFSNMSVSDVLAELSRTTGIEILLNRLPENTIVNKHYTDRTIDEVVKDIFKGKNFALVWHQDAAGSYTLDVWTFDSSSGRSASFSRIERPVSPRPWFPQARQVRGSVEKEADVDDISEPEDSVDEPTSQDSEADDEDEKQNPDSEDDSDMEPDVDEENPSQDESDETTEAESSPIPIKSPEFD